MSLQSYEADDPARAEGEPGPGMHVAPNAKFGAFFLSQCEVNADLPPEEEIEAGLWVSRRLGIDIAEHWRRWLGSVATDGMTEGGLSVYVTAPSAHPDINDGENAALEQRANDLFNGLLLQGVPHIERGFVVHGANVDGDIHIRGYSPTEHHYRTAGLDFIVGMAEVRRSVALAQRIREIENSPTNWERLIRGIRTLLLANRQSNEVGDRLHQFVRTLEAVLKPRIGESRNSFGHRGQTLALNSEDTRGVLLQLFDLRSSVEHLNVPTDALPPGGTEAERRELVNRRTRQADALARFALLRILESPEMFEVFRTDDGIDAFWRLDHAARIARWGTRLDILAIQ